MHGLLPILFLLIIVLFVAQGDLLLPLLAEGFFVAVPMCGGSIPHGISVLIALQSFPQLDQTTHSMAPVRSRVISPNSRLLQGM